MGNRHSYYPCGPSKILAHINLVYKLKWAGHVIDRIRCPNPDIDNLKVSPSVYKHLAIEQIGPKSYWVLTNRNLRGKYKWRSGMYRVQIRYNHRLLYAYGPSLPIAVTGLLSEIDFLFQIPDDCTNDIDPYSFLIKMDEDPRVHRIHFIHTGNVWYARLSTM